MAGIGALAGTNLLPLSAFAQTRARVIIIGGGFGGATAARMLRDLLPSARITLLEPNATYTACPFSNLVIGGTRSITDQHFSYDALSLSGITVIPEHATDVDPVARVVTCGDGRTLAYDRLILSPGIDFRWNAIEGYDAAAVDR
ncbi:FAD-dependent oxidoreductase, partial [Hyphomonas sp.]|uniref:FAD-dependent oxidoreductase n=1 Tax=Hyphomonas sp. TaxID=87 RepID=UPI0039E3C0A0